MGGVIVTLIIGFFCSAVLQFVLTFLAVGSAVKTVSDLARKELAKEKESSTEK